MVQFETVKLHGFPRAMQWTFWVSISLSSPLAMPIFQTYKKSFRLSNVIFFSAANEWTIVWYSDICFCEWRQASKVHKSSRLSFDRLFYCALLFSLVTMWNLRGYHRIRQIWSVKSQLVFIPVSKDIAWSLKEPSHWDSSFGYTRYIVW